MVEQETKQSEQGSVILETGIVLPIFILVILFLYGLFIVFSVRNQITAAMFQSAKSLSMDPYLTEHVDSIRESKEYFWSSLGGLILDVARGVGNDKHYSNMTDWYSASGANVSKIAKDRFIGFFAGGDENEAKEKAKDLGIVNGLNGINISASISGKQLTIKVEYKIQTWFDAFDLGKIPVKQSYTVALWGVKEK